ncbi:sugar ABC transporter ATP-binding protein [Corynebacterium sp. 320]|uniref:ATP-binding cassette domain-containing protein n=1 Tax=Corynebacterium TaxID=1716 RepID=UPI00125CA869|nr:MULTISPECIES: ATP-binding cassette domain-containing protein [Corynebacterium]KAB1504212.1 sugar ABC transporter ATP-binding protein [Corynebacterium sp. 320]KAB1552688.1 sugar ABC transporter ATP-binding protein [Corynebacterium sp. 321]KAB1554094.1 sugar ABC transporter ATP-binding protein [Corynebacterium sp. 319]KAB3528348.1 sugar ABC transporter ATP-binding protein [Corynebacterium sp. 250]KAB3540163.1 sugar ABC transporter ATP-binding protein [Corynebacterium sp. 366]
MSDHNTAAPANPEAASANSEAIVQLVGVDKAYGDISILKDINLTIIPGQVTCVLGDNGAGKSTLIKILAGRHPHSAGQLLVDGEEVHFKSPKDSLDRGIATVYQDLAVVGQMSVWRNFFLGQELTGRFGTLKADQMRRIAADELKKMGIDLPNVDMEIANLSGGQRQVVAIARALYFGARVLILDEPTAALGVKQSGMVLRFVKAAADRGVAVILITHNPHHAHLVGHHFVLLNMGRQTLDASYTDVTLEQLTLEMAGGGELDTLSHELEH